VEVEARGKGAEIPRRDPRCKSTREDNGWVRRDIAEVPDRPRVRREHIFTGGHIGGSPAILPSDFRPSKNWDLVVIANSRFHGGESSHGEPVLYCAVEFKSQDKSIGNNQNNRLEESLGNACDFWKTYEHSGFIRLQPRPWLGYLFVGNYCADEDEKPVRVRQPHMLAMPPFRAAGSDTSETYAGPSYAERYQAFLRQSVGARLYDAGAFIVTDASLARRHPNHRIRFPEFGPEAFLRSLKAQIFAHYPGAAIKPGSMAASL
jgi:hypothetical protein